MKNKKKLIDTTKQNIVRNRWLSFSTIFVIAVVFTISTFFIGMATIAQKAVKYYETRAQVIVFFKKESPEAEIFKFRDTIYDSETIEDIEYISQDEALEIYREDFKDDPDLIETVTADSLPPSLGIRAKSIDDLQNVIKDINLEKEKNAYIDEVFYFKDVVDNMKTLSKVINYGTITLTVGLGIITFALISITIGFNILAHKEEIEIMHLVGSSDSYIKTPYLIEGALYGAAGGLISSILILVPLYIAVGAIKSTDFYIWISQLFTDLSMSYIIDFSFLFVLVFIMIQLLIGASLGSIASYSAVLKYLNAEKE